MAVRVRPDNLSLVDPAVQAGVDLTRIDFEELWEHRESLRAICLRMADDPTTADDVVQDTFVRALAHAETLDKRESFAPWLATVARRRSVDEIRLRRRVRPVAAMPEGEAGAAEDPAEQVLKQEMVRRLRTALGDLKPRERQLLLRQVTHGLTLAELAEEEDTSIASVRSVLNRARTKLRGSLERGGPLAVAPLPRLVAAIKRRLQGVAARLESHMPLLGTAGAQLGDVVAAVIAAVALLAGPAAPEASTTFLSQLPAATSPAAEPAARSTTPTAASRHASAVPTNTADPATAAATGPAPGQPLTALPPGVDLPPLSDGVDQPDDAVIEQWAVADDGNTVIAGGLTTGDGGNTQASGEFALFRSDDAGRSWHRLPAGGLSAGRVLLPPAFPQTPTFFVDNGVTLQRTDDGGRNFGSALTATRNASGISPHYRQGDYRILVAPGVLAAYDTVAGTTTPFTSVPMSSSGFGSLAFPPQFDQDGTVLIGGGVTYPGRFDGYVQACTPIRCGNPVEVPGMKDSPKLLVSSSVPGVILAWSFSGLARSTDGGKSFTQVDLPVDRDLKAVIDGAPGELLAARWGQGSHVGGLFRSRDGGRTWSRFAFGTVLQRGAWSLGYLPSGRILAKPSDASGVLCSADGGVSWAPRCS
jgi:RNA polymerase sigma-70 factor (ECF subfamily)